MDDGLILAGLILAVLSVPMAIIIARATARSRQDVSGHRVALPIAFALSFLLCAIWVLRIGTSTRSEDYGSLAALFLGLITVPLCFVATLAAALFTVRHVRKVDGE